MTKQEPGAVENAWFRAALAALIWRNGGEVSIAPEELFIRYDVTGMRAEDGSLWLKVLR
jgi:hypothetical protein